MASAPGSPGLPGSQTSPRQEPPPVHSGPGDGTVSRAAPEFLKETHLEPPPLRVTSKPQTLPSGERRRPVSLARAAVDVHLDPGPPHFGNGLSVYPRRPTGSAQLFLEWGERLRKPVSSRVKGAPLAGLSPGSAVSSLWLWTLWLWTVALSTPLSLSPRSQCDCAPVRTVVGLQDGCRHAINFGHSDCGSVPWPFLVASLFPSWF